jgi:MFS family permease
MVIPDLPVLLKQLNGLKYSWLIIPTFAVVALITRPLSGKLSDTVGRVFVMCIGAVVTTMACAFYLFFINRAFHGICAGFTPTGFTAYADDVVPLSKRGEAMGIVGIFNNMGNAFGWVIGSKCTNMFGLDTMFIIASSLGVISYLMFTTLKESIPVKKRFSLKLLRVHKHELLERRVLLPGFILFLVVFSSGAILALIADFTTNIGIKNKGMYMAIYILSSLVVRFMAGRWSDRFGRKKIALLGSMFLCMSMIALAFTTEIYMYSLSSVLFGVGFGLISPSIFAWAADLSLPGYKGKAVGTLFIFLEIGIITGSSVTGLLYNNDPANFFICFMISGVLAFVPVFFLLDKKLKIKPEKYLVEEQPYD